MEKILRNICLLFAVSSIFLSGCHTGNSEVRMIPSPYFGGPIHYMDLNDIGDEYYGSSNQTIGMVYTCRGGFIDMGHLCESVNRTLYVHNICLRNLRAGSREFSFSIIEPAEYTVRIKYPSGWDSLSLMAKDKIIQEASIELGEYISQRSVVLHEMITWWGYSSVTLFSEKPSSFSWEDLYSDFLGANISGQALRERGEFNSSVTKLIKQNLTSLDIQDKETARKATERIKGVWYDGGPYPFINMKKRNFDIGLSGYITPWLVPGICPSALPQQQKSSILKSISSFGFKSDVEIQVRCSQGKKLEEIAGSSIISPEKDFPKIIQEIQSQAMQ